MVTGARGSTRAMTRTLSRRGFGRTLGAMRSFLLALSLACSSIPAAHAQPAPRITLDVELKMEAGFGVMSISDGPRVAVAADGTIAVVLAEHRSSASEEALQLEVFAFDRDGR